MKHLVTKDRKDFVDIAKGLTILLVVIEHNVFIYKYQVVTQTIILSFHMPLFFFVSGLFFSIDEDLSCLTQKRFHSLVKPYLASCLLFFLLKSAKNCSVGDIPLFLAGVLYGTGESLSWPYQPLWFMTSLFVTVVACRVFYDFLKRFELVWLRTFFLFVLLAVGVAFIKNLDRLPSGGLPWNLDLLGITVFFYALGFEMSKWFFRIKGTPVLYLLVSLIIFVTLQFFFTVVINEPAALNLALRKYDSFIVNSLEAVSGVLVIIFLSIVLAKHFLSISRLFAYIGRRSLTVFVFHELFMLYIGNVGKVFLRVDSFPLFSLTIILTVGMTLVAHELVIRIPVVRYLLLNERVQK